MSESIAKIHPSIIKQFPEIVENKSQIEAISTIDGPLLIIAGPGSGKTFVLVLRALNILLFGLAEPKELIICSFTEKSAFELRDRLSNFAKKLGYEGDLHEIHIGTIHALSNDYLMRQRYYTPLGNNYDVLDDLTQKLFIFDNFNNIVGEKTGKRYFGKWSTKWNTIRGLTNYFNKISEELIDVSYLKNSHDLFVKQIGFSYERYLSLLVDKNKVDFSLIQTYFYDLLKHQEVGKKIIKGIKYVLVDEYQDTNFVQEQILLKLTEGHHNLCVVGDEDQSLYRFRGATVRNILEFGQHFNKYNEVNLTINYRSHKDIIKNYNAFMNSWDWSSNTGEIFRYEKTISPNPKGKFPEYPAVFSVWGTTARDEAKRVAEAIKFFKDNKIIEDYNQIAILLHSVRSTYSGRYIEELEKLGINSFCPRQRGFFDNKEIQLMIACFTILLSYYGDNRGEIKGGSLLDLTRYLDEQITELGRKYPDPHPLAKSLQESTTEIKMLEKGGTLDKRLADYFYQFLSMKPFSDYVKNENRARNLAIFSQLLNTFQNYYHYTVITSKNLPFLRLYFFNSFLRLLFMGGINEYEDPDVPFPKNHVQIMTIHQSKGLEFPVVIVDSLSKSLSSPKELDRKLSPYFHRPLFEPEDKITGFDRMRLHYVAFSRGEKILILTTHERPNYYFNPIWQGLPQWPYVQTDVLKSLYFRMKNRFKPKKSFSFTSDLKTYETCPRQYLFFRHYDFTPSRSAEVFFGSLVHQTIEEIHRYVISEKKEELTDDRIREIFEFNFKQLLNSGMRPLGKIQKELAFKHVMNYYNQNQKEMSQVIETEVDVSLEKGDYILLGKIDLLLGNNDELEILDFKSLKKPAEDNELIKSYHRQLCIYAHIIEERYNKTPKRLVIYWTGQEKKENARMVFPYEKDLVSSSIKEFDHVVRKILNKNFIVTKLPEKNYCRECDIKEYCINEGLISKKGRQVK